MPKGLLCLIEVIHICRMRRLTILNAHSNSLNGQLPSCLSTIAELEFLLLHSNEFDGDFPLGLDRQPKLQIITMHDNRLSGSLPSDMRNLTGMKVLTLHNNNLRGSVPELKLSTECKDYSIYSIESFRNLPAEVTNNPGPCTNAQEACGVPSPPLYLILELLTAVFVIMVEQSLFGEET